MKLIRSMPGVPSATPAHENSACSGPPHSSTAASIEAFWALSTLVAFAPSRAPPPPLPVAPPTTSPRLPSYLYASNVPMSSPCRSLSGHHAADLEVHDRVPVDPELAEDRVAVLVEPRRPPGRPRLPVVLDGCGAQPEGHALRGRAVLHVAVG